MRFNTEEPDTPTEINLIPLIDVLLVMLIFLAATTTFAPQVALKISLPKSGSADSIPASTILAISQNGQFALGGELISGGLPEEIALALREGIKNPAEVTLVIYADSMTPHQFVVNAMQAARAAGIGKVNFATQARD
jgi:biopolymer transport protein ExbD